jgi:GNAT superfamily N-acetyltransferase
MSVRPDPAPVAALARVRLARLEDAPAIGRLAGQLNYPSTAEQVVRRLRRLEGDAEHMVYLAELADGLAGAVIGWVHVHERHLVESDTQAEIMGLVVEESYRGLGAGRLLMQAAEQWARSRGCGLVVLRSNVIRGRAHAFYEKLGYENFKTQKVFRKVL